MCDLGFAGHKLAQVGGRPRSRQPLAEIMKAAKLELFYLSASHPLTGIDLLSRVVAEDLSGL